MSEYIKNLILNIKLAMDNIKINNLLMNIFNIDEVKNRAQLLFSILFSGSASQSFSIINKITKDIDHVINNILPFIICDKKVKFLDFLDQLIILLENNPTLLSNIKNDYMQDNPKLLSNIQYILITLKQAKLILNKQKDDSEKEEACENTEEEASENTKSIEITQKEEILNIIRLNNIFTELIQFICSSNIKFIIENNGKYYKLK